MLAWYLKKTYWYLLLRARMSKDNLIPNDDYANTDQIPGFVKLILNTIFMSLAASITAQNLLYPLIYLHFYLAPHGLGSETYGTGL